MKRAIRGPLLTFTDDPFLTSVADSYLYEEDGAVVIEDGLITAVGAMHSLRDQLPTDVLVTHYPDHLILPGFIDAHVHYPQTGIIASHGAQLIEWLNKYTFVEEQRFEDRSYADEVAELFLNELIKNGTTAACVFCTTHPQSVDALFERAQHRHMRMMAGKVCMDRNAPDRLLDTAQRAYNESQDLIKRWHGKGRAEYVITPRFAPTSSEAQLEMIGQLAAEYPRMLIQSHISENLNEVAWVKELFPWAPHYSGVYEKYGLLRKRAIYGHGLHLSAHERELFSASESAIAHCPTSNFFLGSGFLHLAEARSRSCPITIGLATDVGAGTSFSMLQTMNAAYKAAHLNGSDLHPMEAFYLATRGAAEALGVADRIGSLAPGLEADMTVLNLRSTPLIDFRMRSSADLDETLFVQMTLADDRAIAATYIAGQLVYETPS